MVHVSAEPQSLVLLHAVVRFQLEALIINR